MSDLDSIDDISDAPKALPNATASLVLGIVSIATCWLYGIPGIVCGIIAIVLSGKDKTIYNSNPAAYANSYKNSNAGRICGIIGLCLSVLWLIYIVWALMFLSSIQGSPFNRW
jgi:hypothetical protein